jgi:hypothetical protein
MPTPLELQVDPLMLSVLAIFAGLALWEALVQRPEIHSWHHARGFAPEQGFHDGASSRYVSLLACRDVAASNGGVS